MAAVQIDNKLKDCESLMIKFIKLKEIFTKISTKKSNSIVKGKIPDLKEIHRHLHTD